MIIGVDGSKISDDMKTGIEYFSYQLIFNILKYDKTNRYIIYSPNKIDNKFCQFENAICKTIPTIKFWNKIRLPRELKKDKPDIFFQPGYMIPSYNFGKKVVVLHDFAYLYFPHLYSRKNHLIQFLALKKACKSADAILFISKSAENDFEKICPSYNKIRKVIYLGINSQEFSQKKIPTKKIYKIINREYLLYVGRIESKKNIINLIKGYEIFREKSKNKIMLILAGKNGYGSKNIEEAITDSLYSKDILTTGYLDIQELICLYQNAEAFIFPSKYEGFGIPILEAFATKIPVACSNTSSMPEIAQNGALYFNPNNILEIANAINILLNDSKIRQKLIKKGTERVADFTWEKAAKETIKIFNKL